MPFIWGSCSIQDFLGGQGFLASCSKFEGSSWLFLTVFPTISLRNKQCDSEQFGHLKGVDILESHK